MPGKNFYQYFTKTLAAGEIWTIETDANFLYVIDNTATTKIVCSIGGQSYQTIPNGYSIQLLRENNEIFTRLIFQNNDAGVTTLTFAISNGIVVNNNAQISGTISVNQSATSNTTPAAVTVTTTAAQLIAANTSRREAIISNNGTAGEIVYIGDSNVNAATGRGIPIANGEKIVLSSQAAIWADAVSGSPSVSYMELTA